MNQPSCPQTSGKLLNAIITMGPMDIVGPMDYQGKHNCYAFYTENTSASMAGFFNTTMCSHFAAVHLFINSILNRCTYRGFSCESHEAFQDGQCILSANEGNFMGYHASPHKALGRLYLDTQAAGTAPFCSESFPYSIKRMETHVLAAVHHYQISLVSASNDHQTKGQIHLILVGDRATESVLFDS